MQQSLADAVDDINSQPFLSGKLIKNLSVTSGVAVIVHHGLGQAYQGYFVTRTQGTTSVTVREAAQATTAQAATTVTLVPSASGTIDLFIF